MEKETELKTMWSKIFIILFLSGFHTLFTMDAVKTEKTSSGVSIIWDIILFHTYPLSFKHSCVCSLAETCRSFQNYIVEKAKNKQASIQQFNNDNYDDDSIHRLWHKYGTAYYRAQIFNEKLDIAYYPLKEEKIELHFIFYSVQKIENVKPFIDAQGMYQYPLVVSLDKRGSPGLRAYRFDGWSLKCFGSKTNKDGATEEIDLMEYKDKPDFLRFVLRQKSTVQISNAGTEREKRRLVYDLSHAPRGLLDQKSNV